ncbi:MAG TPA: DUF4235 domain-containing protein [Solirubrobacteraceae bacterium]|nr:DUF4235 domain-containing protein [Solirubrobacteraceae bacterium]
MKLLYKPFGIVAGVVGAKIGQKLFDTLWARVDGGPAPGPKAPDASLARVVAAQSLQAAALAGAGTAADRLGMRWFHHLTGIWPGDKPDTGNERPLEDQPRIEPAPKH